MTGNPQQLVLDLPNRSALGLEDFLVSENNKHAVETIDGWPDWPHQAIVLVGPAIDSFCRTGGRYQK